MSNGAKIVLVVCLFFAVVVVVNIVKRDIDKRDIDEKSQRSGQYNNVGKIRPEQNSPTKSPGTEIPQTGIPKPVLPKPVVPKPADPKPVVSNSAPGSEQQPVGLSANSGRERPTEPAPWAEPMPSLFDPLAGGAGTDTSSRDAAREGRTMPEHSAGLDEGSRAGTPGRDATAGDTVGGDRDLVGPKLSPTNRTEDRQTPPDKSTPPEAKPAVTVAPPSLRTHKVASGDSLWDLAADYLGDPGRFREILAANPELGDGSTLKVGTVVKIPPKELGPKAAGPAKDVVAKDTAGAKEKVAKDGNADAKSKSKEPAPTADKSKYTIQKDDNLYQVAKRLLGNGARWREIVDLNPGLDPENLRVGSVIKVPSLPPK
ncbi:MAG: LysM peptidoglycan-binding domain-containing protein [Planctomycetota bacterium]